MGTRIKLHSKLLLLTFLLICLNLFDTTDADPCPESFSRTKCFGHEKVRFDIRYKRNGYGGCKKVVRKTEIPIKCRPPSSERTKCKDGILRISTIRHIVRNCRCKRIISVKRIKCACKKSLTYRKFCNYGVRKVVTIYYKRIGQRCVKKTRVHREKCLKISAGILKKSYKCKCFAYGSGSIITFDKKKLSHVSKGKCSVLMAKSNDEKCAFRVYSILYENKFRTTIIKFKGNQYRLTHALKLYVNDKPTKVPHEDKGVRIFFSGEYLQFVASKCVFTLGFNGLCNHYIYLGKRYAGRVSGSCGNCDGNKQNDHLVDHAPGGCLRQSHKRGLCSKKAVVTARKLCVRLRSANSAFAKCARISSKFYGGCIRDVCKAWPHKRYMYKRACQVHAIASLACSSKGYLPRWRKKGFCALKCGRNKNYTPIMNPCPKTCENHFFGTSLRCYRLPKRDGCQCRPGYVLDGSQCVQPKRCRCIDKICADRLPRRKCKLFRSKGHCRRNPHIMYSVCKMTCGKCRPKCEDQMSSHRCKLIKAQGKCADEFYQQICRLTCQKKSCHCPQCRVHRSKCHPKYKTTTLEKVCFKLDRFGKCHRITHRKIIKCDKCRSLSKERRGKCNYCKGYRQTIRLHQYREYGYKKKCRKIVKASKIPCYCKKRKSSSVKCIDGKKLVRFNFKKGPIGCHKCGQRKWSNVIKVFKCKGVSVRKTHCSKKTGYLKLILIKSKVKNCKCIKLRHVKHVKCACPKPRKSSPKCLKNSFVRFIKIYKLVRGKCKRHVQILKHRIKCSRKKIVLHKCRKEDCKLFKIKIFKKIRHCRCIGRKRISYVGKCCCPSTRLRKTKCRHNFKHYMKISFELLNGKCIKQIRKWKKRCACPPKKHFKYCDKDHGQKIFGTIRYVLTKSGHCKKILTRRKVPVLCRKLHLRHVSNCGVKLHGLKKFRRVTLTKLKRVGCGCKKVQQSLLEPCGCVERKHRVVKRCPQHCLSSKTCTKDCFKRVYFFATGNLAWSQGDNNKIRCSKRLVGREKYRCCCPLSKKVKKICVKHKYIQTSIYTKVLQHGKCQRRVQRFSERIDCKTGFIKKVRGPNKPDGTFNIKSIHGYIRHCKCRTRMRVRQCLWRCDKPKIRHYCDKTTGEFVTEKYYKRLRGCHCVPVRSAKRHPIKCPHHIRLVKNKCSKLTKMRVKVYEKAFQIGCKCVKKRFLKKSFCMCPKKRVTKFRCDSRINKLRRKIITYKLTKTACLKKIRHQFKPIRCQHNTRFIKKCHPKSGVLIIFKTFKILRHCRCVKRMKLVKKAMCHCKNKPKHRRKFCDKKKHHIVKQHFFYVYDYDTKSCRKKSTKRSFAFDCPDRRIFTTKCNLYKKRRLLIKIFYEKRQCKCKKIVSKRSLPCGCKGRPRKIKHYCDPVKGQFVTVRISRRWVEKANKCIKSITSKKVPVHCKRNIKVTKSKCKNGYYIERKAYRYRNPNKCECKIKIKRTKRNCRCPTKVIRTRCPKHGYFKKLIIINREWNHESGKCKIKKRSVVYRRCRCPLSKRRKYCKNGELVEERLRFKLHGKSCVRIKRHLRFKVNCDSSARRVKRIGCDHKTCTRKIVTFAKVNHPKKCGCIWKPIHIRKCRCCKCPHNIVRTKCVRHNYYRTKITYFTPQKRCSDKCKQHTKVLRREVRCRRHHKVQWSKCNRLTCKKHPLYSKVVLRNCQCKRMRRSGPPVTCCCKSKPMKKTFCHNGKIVKQIMFTRLKKHKCVKIVKHRKRPIKCKRNIIRHYGRCNRETCYKKVWHIKSFLQRHSCTCKIKKRLAKIIPCCCLKKPYKRKFCDGQCHIYKFYRYSFSERSKSCVKHTKTIRRCLKCPPPKHKKGKCNRDNCLRKHFKRVWFMKKCRCHSTVHVKSRVCCCPKPERYKRCDHKTGEIVHRKIYYILTHGRCSKRIKEKRRQIKCHHSRSSRALKCDQSSCKRRIITLTQYRKGCRCKQMKRVHFKTCCCPQSVSHVRCKKDKKIVKLIKKWILTKKGCVSRRYARVLKELHRCRMRHIIGKCDLKSKHRLITTLIYKPKNCKCHLSHKKVRRYLCACPKPIIRYTKCNQKTCHEKKYIIKFHSPEKGKCKRQVKVHARRCCCPHKKWVKHRCNPETGNIEIIQYRKVFNQNDRSCQIKRNKVVKKLHCRSPRQVQVGKCNHRNGRKHIAFTWLVKHHIACKCRRRTKVKQVLCSCKHKGCHNSIKCINGYVVKKRICWRLKDKRCVRVVKLRKKKIVCSRQRHVSRKCDRKSCSEAITKRWSQRVGCKCVKRFAIRKKLCCCPKPYKLKKCAGKFWVHKLVTFSLNNKRTACKRTVQHRRILIKCKRRKVIESRKCHRKTCKKQFRLVLFKVKNCHCKPHKVKKWHKRCCCPKNRKFVKCFKKYGVVHFVSFHYKLVDGYCLTRKDIYQNKIGSAGDEQGNSERKNNDTPVVK